MSKSQNIKVTEAIKNQQNTHVQALTIPKTYKSPFDSAPRVLDLEEWNKMQFNVRRMWALNLVQIMREQLNWDWEGITNATGKTRQTWNNVCLSKSPSYADLHSEDETIKAKARDGYRPVTNSFIRNVTDELEKLNYSIFSHHFREAFDLGLCVVCPNSTVRGIDLHPDFMTMIGIKNWNEYDGAREDLWVINRMGDTPRHQVSTCTYWDADEINDWMGTNYPTAFMFYAKGKDDDGIVGPQYIDGGFPLLNVYDGRWGGHNCEEAIMMIEEAVFEWDEATGEPDPRAENSHNMWRHLKKMSEEGPHEDWEPTPEDPKQFESPYEQTNIKDVVAKFKAGDITQKEAERWIADIKLDTLKKIQKMDEKNVQLQRDLQLARLKMDSHQVQLEESVIDTWIRTGVVPDQVVIDPAKVTIPDLELMEAVMSSVEDPVITSDDRSTETIEVKGQDKGMTQMGFLPTVHLPFEVHPNWLNEDGEVEFKVVISFDNEGNKNGSMIKQIQK